MSSPVRQETADASSDQPENIPDQPRMHAAFPDAQAQRSISPGRRPIHAQKPAVRLSWNIPHPGEDRLRKGINLLHCMLRMKNHAQATGSRWHRWRANGNGQKPRSLNRAGESKRSFLTPHHHRHNLGRRRSGIQTACLHMPPEPLQPDRPPAREHVPSPGGVADQALPLRPPAPWGTAR